MVPLLYDVLIWLADLLFKVVALFHKKAAKIVSGRKSTLQIINNFTTDPLLPVYWFHCASLGEWEQTIPVVEQIKNVKNSFVLVSFYSPSGFENAKRTDLIDLKIYLPVDTSAGYNLIFEKFKIRAIIFTRYDIWPNLVRKASLLNIPLILIGAEFRQGSRYLNKSSFFGNLLKRFVYISCNDLNSYDLIKKAGFLNASLDGSPKIERAFDLTAHPQHNDHISSWKGNDKVIVAGSVWQEEITLIHDCIKGENLNNLKWIIAPHEPSSAMIALLKARFGTEMILYSEFIQHPSDKKIIVIDSIGLLSKLYYYADLAVIGGGFGKGIHNILEPACYGIPVIAGPNYTKFSEASILIELGVFNPVNNFEQFRNTLDGLLSNESRLDSIKSAINKFAKNNKNVSETISARIIKESIEHV